MKKEKDFVAYKRFWFSPRKAGVINAVLENGFYLVDNYYWHESDNRAKYCKIINQKQILG